jgi:hypothetical protein
MRKVWLFHFSAFRSGSVQVDGHHFTQAVHRRSRRGATGARVSGEQLKAEWRQGDTDAKLVRMFAGHLGAGLLLKRAERRVSLGWLFFGAMLLDILLWVFVLAGVENVQVPEHLRSMADLTFDFPYSHSLVASLIWSVVIFTAGWFLWRHSPRQRLACALILAAAVFSHFALDWLVHIPELPVAGRNSMRLGFGLWRNLPLAWGVEAALVALGVWAYLKKQPLDRRRKLALVIVMTLVTAMTIVGQASHSAPPSIGAMAGSSLVLIAMGIWFGWWVDRRRYLTGGRRENGRNPGA